MTKNMERRTFLEAAIAIFPLAALGQSPTPQTSANPVKIEALIEQRKLRRKVHGMAAALMPFAADGQVAVEAFQNHLLVTHHAGLMNAVNMDTGYVNYLSDTEKRDVLRWTREALGKDVPFVSGAYIEGQSGEAVALYRREMDVIASFGGIPILFQTSRLHGKSGKEKAAIYQEVCRGYPQVLAFELGKMFAPNGEILDQETFRRLLDIPEIKGMKHSSLDRLIELERLALRDAQRPDFKIYTGNDLAGVYC
jgi:4-hydroxy-tetrahydrodipicolinate synthase